MNPDWWLKAWGVLHEPFLVVNEPIEVALLLREGGNALVEVETAREMLPTFLTPQVWGEGADDRVVQPRRNERNQKAPTKKLRAAVLKRDHYRCRMCGQRPADDVNVTLDVHHIIPWKDGGLTERANLITVCLTCHRGLHPHFEPKLFELIPDEDRPDQSSLRKTPENEKILYAYSWSKSFEFDDREATPKHGR